jgi:hypothetical protein
MHPVYSRRNKFHPPQYYYIQTDLFLETKPQPVLPAWVCAPGPEHIPLGPAQHALPQSAPLRHWPPINCTPFPLPTFFSPAGSKAGPPALAVLATGATLEATSIGADKAGGAAFGKPHPVFPACVCAPTPEQIPLGPAQHPLAQSAVFKHCPPINCCPFPLPTFFTPEGSKVGPPLNVVPGTALLLPLVAIPAVAEVVEDITEAETATEEDAALGNPHPVLPFWV